MLPIAEGSIVWYNIIILVLLVPGNGYQMLHSVLVCHCSHGNLHNTSLIFFLPLHFCSVFGAVVFTAISVGRVTSFAPDASKAQASAARILALINRKPLMETSSTEGIQLVNQQVICQCFSSCRPIHVGLLSVVEESPYQKIIKFM